MRRTHRFAAVASASVIGLMAPATVLGAPDGDRGYVVEPGDYLFGIARQQGVSVSDLLAANRLTLSSVIHPGQRLVVPGPAASSAGGGRYTVRPGDSLLGIARRLGVSSRSLLAANGLMLASVIHPWQRLVIPARPTGSSVGSGASPTPASAQDVERIIRDVWPDALEERALAIAWRESRYEARAQGQCCSGLFQIYLYQRAGGWAPWSLAGR